LSKLFKLRKPATDQLLIIGIVSTESDYKVSWTINQSLHIHLTRSHNIKLPNTKTGIISEFPLYLLEDEKNQIKYFLIKNRNENLCYIDELKKFDYLFFLQGEISEIDKNLLLIQIKSFTILSSSFYINPQIIKNQDKIILF
jgi:hypothetical protein